MERTEMEKKAILGELGSMLLWGGLGHVAQNQALKYALKEKKFSNAVGQRLLNKGSTSDHIRRGAADAIFPELGLMQKEILHGYRHHFNNMSWKEKVGLVHTLKGDWVRMSKSKAGKQMLKKHLSKVFPMAGHMIDKLPESTIEKLEHIYKNDMVGKNISALSDYLKKFNPASPEEAKIPLSQRAATTAGNLAWMKVEPGIGLFNTSKHLLTSDIKSLEKTKPVQKIPGLKGLVRATHKVQKKFNDFFTTDSFKDTAEAALTDNPKTKLIESILRNGGREFGNALVGGSRDLEYKLLTTIKERHPELAKKTYKAYKRWKSASKGEKRRFMNAFEKMKANAQKAYEGG